jgi:hypothetical protein
LDDMGNTSSNNISSWLINHKFWASVIIIFIFSVLIILIFKSASIIDFISELFGQIIYYAKYPLLAFLTILQSCIDLFSGQLGTAIARIFAGVAGTILYPLTAFGELLGQMGKEEYAKALAYALSVYIVIGGLIWSIISKKKGLTLIVIGSIYSFSILVYLLLALPAEIKSVNFIDNLVIPGVFAIISALCFYFGINRYLMQKRSMKTSLNPES